MKKILIVFLCFSAMLAFCQEKKEDTAKEELIKKEQALLMEQKLLARKMFELRVKLLKTDPELKTLYDKIMEQHKELALKLDSNKEMRALLSKMKTIQSSLEEIKKQKK